MNKELTSTNERISEITKMESSLYAAMLNSKSATDEKIINAVELAKTLRTTDKRSSVVTNKNVANNYIGTHYNYDNLSLKTIELLIIFGSDDYFDAISDLDNETIALTYYTDLEHVKAFRALQNRQLTIEETPKKLIK